MVGKVLIDLLKEPAFDYFAFTVVTLEGLRDHMDARGRTWVWPVARQVIPAVLYLQPYYYFIILFFSLCFFYLFFTFQTF